jgi:hypothetical protein
MDHITIGKKQQTLGAISTPISALIGDKLKQLIWKDQYIDLALLLLQNNINKNQKSLQFQVVANSTLSVIPNKPMYSLYNIEQWTTTFIRSYGYLCRAIPRGHSSFDKTCRDGERDGNISKQ